MKRILLGLVARLLQAASKPPRPMPRIRWY
jgi:hypothetical protein